MLVAEENSTTYYGDNIEEESDSVCEDLLRNRFEKDIDNNNASSNIYYIDDNTDANMKRDNTIMFENSKTTVDEVIEMIHSYCVRFNCSDEARFALFNMARTWAGLEFSRFMSSKYEISKRLNPPQELFQYIFYCTKCNCLLGKYYKNDVLPTYEHCKKCQEKYKIATNSSNCFLSIDIKFQLQTLIQNSNVRKLLLKNVKEIENRLQKNVNTIVDVYDGELYKTLYYNTREKTILLTFNFNIDGAPISKSSKSSMWPIQLIINELPLNIRFRYILIAGLWITKSEPSSQFINLYMNAFIDQIRDLMTNGIVINIDNEECNLILQPLCSSVDSVARPIIHNRYQFNGYFGCSWCYQYGNYTNGAMRYPFMDEDPPLREHKSYIMDMKNAEKIGRPCNGVKNFAEISRFENFDCVWGFPFDYMHGLLLGIVHVMD